MIVLDEEELSFLLNLNEGERVVTTWAAPELNAICVGIEGPGLDEVAAGAEAPRVYRLMTPRPESRA